MTQTPYTQLKDDERRKRLYFRAWHRGIREMDLLMGRYADAFLAQMTSDELDQFEALLDVPDQDIFSWLLGRQAVPAEYNSSLYQALSMFHSQYKHT